MIFIKQKPDYIGAMASTLCLIHCIATPFIFIVQSCSITNCNGVPTWWGFIDYFFLVISFFAVYRSTQTTSEKWMKTLLWIAFFTLFIIITNEKNAWFYLDETFIYVPAVALIGLHLYNKKYCQCNQGKCCTNEG
ncbi:MerC domain-containing protein [Wenyingzhuangia sp. 2_MG-2023]|uniref:MerC domain-containing protein n=1 Tax=Wenyingzhuangia sp. 2_MG-2023 TaxID=3062639 RepID=UPI0026E3E269|nr:MerC domain-containing protein [Wenyingzhuangia sp. 2_MG-2023]MDO6737434.1 MerC domain-containing protein [Wenyingzhuangia sp. 2_MG-2023]